MGILRSFVYVIIHKGTNPSSRRPRVAGTRTDMKHTESSVRMICKTAVMVRMVAMAAAALMAVVVDKTGLMVLMEQTAFMHLTVNLSLVEPLIILMELRSFLMLILGK